MNAVVRWAARAVVPVLALGQLLVVAPPAHAAAVPWRFSLKVSASFGVAPKSMASGAAECPPGYVVVGGGLQSVSGHYDFFERVAEYRAGDRHYQVIGHNYHADQTLTVTVAANCALAEHVGSLEHVFVDLGRAGSMAGGTATCPAGKVALLGGADWSYIGTDTRRIDFTSPTPDGRGWYATGYSPQNGATLRVEAYCAPASDIGAAPVVQTQDVATTGNVTGKHICPAGRRVVSAGVFTSAPGAEPDPLTYLGHSSYSYPSNATTWTSLSTVLGGARLTSVTWCVTASKPVVVLQQKPPAFTTSSEATFLSVASDPAGEALDHDCSVDYPLRYYDDCPNGTPFTVTDLAEGEHAMNVYAKNVSGQVTIVTHTWVVDRTKPAATGPAATTGVGGPITVAFSEVVTGVAATSFQVRVAGQSATVPGRVTLGTTGAGGTSVSWVPSSPLVPGEAYTVSLTSAIKDRAGNALTPVGFVVRVPRLVENTSAALRETWDPDASGSASGGGYAVSGTVGSAATWRFSATAGQTATLYGVRQRDGGYAEVWVDGVRKATVSLYRSATAFQSKLYTTPALPAGTHTVEVRVRGTKPAASAGTLVPLDFLKVGARVLQETAARQSFRRVATPATAASGGSYDVVPHRTGGDTGGAPAYTLTFRGTGVRLYATRSAAAGSARVYVDGVLRRTVSLRSATTEYRRQVFALTGLLDGRHVVKVVPVGTATGASSAVAVDYLTAI